MATASCRIAVGLLVALLVAASASERGARRRVVRGQQGRPARRRRRPVRRRRSAVSRGASVERRSSTEDDPRRATSVNNLAYILHAQGRYLAAEPHYRESLAMREAALGPDHPDVAQSCNNLAELYRVLGRYGEAEPLHLRALEIREAAFGAKHPEVAQTLNNLGVLYANQGLLREGRAALSARARDPHRLLRQGPSDDRRDPPEPRHAVLRPGALRRGGAALSAGARGRAEGARRRPSVARHHAVEPRRAAPHPGPPRRGRSSCIGGRSGSARRRSAPITRRPRRASTISPSPTSPRATTRRAEELYERSIAIKEAALGADHPELALTLNNLAELYRTQRRFDEAEPLYVRALADRRGRASGRPIRASRWASTTSRCCTTTGGPTSRPSPCCGGRCRSRSRRSGPSTSSW